MEGPTPVSALIHAATMVAAGVYMLVRVSFLIAASAFAGDVIAWIGGITALLAALMATQQNDIKRILAYSTLSQLGYMVMAVGLGAPRGRHVPPVHPCVVQGRCSSSAPARSFTPAITSRTSGKWAGCDTKMPVTFWTFVAGTAALIAVPFVTSGLWQQGSHPRCGVGPNKFLLFASPDSPRCSRPFT